MFQIHVTHLKIYRKDCEMKAMQCLNPIFSEPFQTPIEMCVKDTESFVEGE